MAKGMTKAQLVDENIQLRVLCDKHETTIARQTADLVSLGERGINEISGLLDQVKALKNQVDAMSTSKNEALLRSVDAVLSAVHQPAGAPVSLPGRLCEADRRERSARYFEANPSARSVTNAQLLSFR